MKYDFDEVINRRGTYSSKWDSGERLIKNGIAERFDEGTIPLFTADMDFACPPPVLKAMQDVLDGRIFGYTDCKMVPAYYEAVIHWFTSRYGWEIKTEEILYMNGTVEALETAIKAFTHEEDGIIIQRPVYGPFTGIVGRTGRSLINNPLINQNGYYTMDYEDLERKAADKRNKMLLLCSPHNPVGRVWTKKELCRAADICRRYGVLLVADEIHGDIVRKGINFCPVGSICEPDNLIVCTSVNKTFNLAGLQCSNVIITNTELRNKYIDTAGYRAPTPFAIAALIAAYRECSGWVEELNEYIDSNIDWTLEFLRERLPKVNCKRPEGSYILWMDFNRYGFDRTELRERIYRNANVILESGSFFDPESGGGFERACLGTRRSLLKEAFQRIAEQF